MKRFAWESTPLINCMIQFSDGELCDLQDQIMMMHKAVKPPVEYLKSCLGRQKFTWNGEYRFWVWEGDDWRVFASNIQGTSFEVRDERLSKERVIAAWNDFRVRVGLMCPFPKGTRLLAYVSDEPCVSLGPDPKHPGHVRVQLGNHTIESVHIDNLRKDSTR